MSSLANSRRPETYLAWRAAIRAHLARGPASVREVARATGASVVQTRGVLKRMVLVGHVVAVGQRPNQDRVFGSRRVEPLFALPLHRAGQESTCP